VNHFGLAVVAAVVVAAIITTGTGAPPHLPAVALSSVVLFHLERIVALLAACVALMVMVNRAWGGQLPSEISTQGIKYSDAGLEAMRDELVSLRADRDDVLLRIEAIEGEAYRVEDD
jgi:hypothetical protein